MFDAVVVGVGMAQLRRNLGCSCAASERLRGSILVACDWSGRLNKLVLAFWKQLHVPRKVHEIW